MATKVSSVPGVRYFKCVQNVEQLERCAIPTQSEEAGCQAAHPDQQAGCQRPGCSSNPQLLLNIRKLQLDRIALSQQITAWYKRMKASPGLNYRNQNLPACYTTNEYRYTVGSYWYNGQSFKVEYNCACELTHSANQCQYLEM